MKIAIISMIRDPWGGSEELWADMAIEALKKNYSVIHSTYHFHVIAAKEQYLIDLGLQHNTRRGFINPGTTRVKRVFLKVVNYITNKLQNPFYTIIKFNPDYILYNGTCYSIINEPHLIKVLKKRKIPFGILGHYNRDDGKDISNKQAEEIRQIYSLAKNVFFVSYRSLAIAQKRIVSNIPNAIIVRNPVNITSLDIVAYPQNTTINFALVGNLRVVHKGQDIVIKILGSDAWKNGDWHLNIYGTGEDKQLLFDLVQQLQLEQRVSFYGKVTDIRKLWEDNHILLMPSLMEGMPLAVVEAMICGRPIVATDVGGHSEWIEDQKQGWISPEANVSYFKDAMERAWKNRNRWQQMGVEAHKKALSLYDLQPGKTLLNHVLKTFKN